VAGRPTEGSIVIATASSHGHDDSQCRCPLPPPLSLSLSLFLSLSTATALSLRRSPLSTLVTRAKKVGGFICAMPDRSEKGRDASHLVGLRLARFRSNASFSRRGICRRHRARVVIATLIQESAAKDLRVEHPFHGYKHGSILSQQQLTETNTSRYGRH